jgi:Fe-S-cluster containining protein
MKLTVVQEAAPWYKDGLRFHCTQCGNCCTGGPGYVWLTSDEAGRLAQHLGLTVADTVRKYCRNVSGRLSLKETLRDGLHDCIFLKEIEVPVDDAGAERMEKKRVCSVYPVRPLQCRTWPFWDGNLASPENWARAGSRCPGIGQGRVRTQEEIENARDAEDWET